MQKLDLSNVVYLVDGSAPLWPTANGFLLSIVFHSPQRQRYKEYLKQGVLFIMNPWSFDEMQQLAVLDRSYPENTTVSCWQQKHVDVCQIVCNLFALPSARNWVSYDDHVGPSCCAMQWREWYSKRGGVPRTVFADVSDSEDEIVQDAVSNMSLSAIRRATQVITGLNPGSHQIFVITRASGGYALARQLQSRCES